MLRVKRRADNRVKIMAYGNVLGYTPTAQPGAYKFQQANGQSILLSGPPAENLKARLDASSSLSGQQVAGPGGGESGVPANSVMAGSGALNVPEPAPPETAQAGPAISAAPPETPAPAMSMAPPVAPAPVEVAAHGPTVENATTASGERPAVAMPQVPTAHPVFEAGINTGLIQLPDGTLAKRAPGVAAITQKSLLDKAASGVALPHSATESTTGGFTLDQDYLERRHDLAIDKRIVIDKTADVEAENAVREKQLADQQFQQAAAIKAEETARTAQITAQVQRDLETKDRLQKEYGNAKVDPRRIFSGQGGTARGVLAAISAGLGAAGAGLQAMGGHPGQPNLAYQAVTSAIDRDITAQEGEIKIKGEMANNALSQYLRSGLSLDQSKVALRSAQLGWTAAQTAQSAALTKGSLVDVNRDALHNQLLSGLNDADEQYRVQSLGTATKSVASQVAYPHAGSAGGIVRLTPEQSEKFITHTTETGGKQATTAAELDKIAHPKAGVAGKQQGALADNQAAQQELVRAAAAAGLSYNARTGSFEGQAPAILREGAGSFNKDYTTSLGAAAPLVLKAQGIARIGHAEQEAWTGKGKTMSGEQNTKFLQSQLESLKAKERAIKAGGGGISEGTAPPEPEPVEE